MGGSNLQTLRLRVICYPTEPARCLKVHPCCSMWKILKSVYLNSHSFLIHLTLFCQIYLPNLPFWHYPHVKKKPFKHTTTINRTNGRFFIEGPLLPGLSQVGLFLPLSLLTIHWMELISFLYFWPNCSMFLVYLSPTFPQVQSLSLPNPS